MHGIGIRSLGTMLLLVAIVPGMAATAASLIESLAAQLHELRALPMATATKAECPSGIRSLIGLNQEKVRGALGEPDVIDASKNRWGYFFTSPIPLGQRGGGFPQLVFVFGSSRTVVDISCRYAR